MRLICPNCGAQYEVAEDVIPAGGRDVQCSNCGHTWFEEPGESERAEQAAMQQAEQPQPAASEPEPDQDEHPEPAPEPTPEPTPEPEPERERAPVTPDRAREIDPQVAEILRAEAEFEQAVRRSEAQPIETQTDMGLEDNGSAPDQRSREARNRLARLRGEPEAGSPAAVAAVATNTPRRELLPDIDVINSTLRSDTGRGAVEQDMFDEPAPRGGFRRGFLSVVVVALLGLGAYAGSDRIAAMIPATKGPVISYVAWVDGMRGWLNDRMQSLADQRSTPEGMPDNDAPAQPSTDG